MSNKTKIELDSDSDISKKPKKVNAKIKFIEEKNVKNVLIEESDNNVVKKVKQVKKIELNKNSITKEAIIKLFEENVKGKKYINGKDDHDGGEGQWLEKLMNLAPNSKNAPDIGGYEMKKESKKISFGDWSGEYLFSAKRKSLTEINKKDIHVSKEDFCKYFGNKNEEKEDRYSWSGSCVPKYGEWNECGQKLKIDDDKNIISLYSYEKDKRKNKTTTQFKYSGEICIAIWKNTKMKKHVESKFNQKGFFICKKNKNDEYEQICFGPKIDYDLFIEKIKTKDIFFDSGMYHDSEKPNNRLYSQWRASKKFWDDLLIQEDV
jgi:hypothetical protein